MGPDQRGVADAFFAPFQSRAVRLGDARLLRAAPGVDRTQLAQSPRARRPALAALVREAFDDHYGEVGLVPPARARGRRAVADHGRVLWGKAVAGIAMHLAVTGLRRVACRPQRWSRATTPAARGPARSTSAARRRRGGAAVRVAVAQTQLQHCVQGASGLEDGAALELRLEPNRRGAEPRPVQGRARSRSATRDGRPVRLRAERPTWTACARAGPATIASSPARRSGASGGWLVEAPAPAPPRRRARGLDLRGQD